MKGYILVFLAVVPILFVSAGNGRQDSGAQRAALLEAERNVVNVANSRDVEGIVATYTDDAVGIPPNTPTLIGKDALRDYVRHWVQMQGVITHKSVKAEVSHDGAFGYTVSQYEIATTRPDGSREVIRKGRWVQVWRKQDGTWRLAVEIWNSGEPAIDSKR